MNFLIKQGFFWSAMAWFIIQTPSITAADINFKETFDSYTLPQTLDDTDLSDDLSNTSSASGTPYGVLNAGNGSAALETRAPGGALVLTRNSGTYGINADANDSELDYYTVSLDLYVSTGTSLTLELKNSNDNQTAITIEFSSGTANINSGSESFSYDHDEWFNLRIYIDETAGSCSNSDECLEVRKDGVTVASGLNYQQNPSPEKFGNLFFTITGGTTVKIDDLMMVASNSSPLDDNSNPTVTADSGNSKTGSTNPHLDISATDDTYLTKLQYRFNDAGGVLKDFTSDGAAALSVSGTSFNPANIRISGTDFNSITAGDSATIYVVATDAAGKNNTALEMTVTRTATDTTDPAVTLNNGNSFIAATNPDLDISATDNVELTSVQYRIGAGSITNFTSNGTTAIGTAISAATFNPTTIMIQDSDFNAIADGDNIVITVVATDSSGNSDSTKTITISKPAVADTTDPTFGGATSASADSSSAITISWSAANDDTTAQGNIVYDIYQASATGGQSYTTPTATSAAGATSHQITGLSASTQYFFVVRARDEAGNRDSNTTEVNATTPAAADTTDPVVTLNNGNSFISATNPDLDISATDNVELTSVQYRFNDAAGTLKNFTSDGAATVGSSLSSATFSPAEIRIQQSDFETIATGQTVTIFIIATDAAGNTATGSLTITNQEEYGDFSASVIAPNRFVASNHSKVTFMNLPQSTSIEIYAMNGKKVFETSFSGTGNYEYRVNDTSGQSLSSGLYFVILRSAGGAKKVLKLAVVR